MRGTRRHSDYNMFYDSKKLTSKEINSKLLRLTEESVDKINKFMLNFGDMTNLETNVFLNSTRLSMNEKALDISKLKKKYLK